MPFPADLTCPLPDRRSDDVIRQILTTVKTIAVVGMSPNPKRPSHGIGLYLHQNGYTVVPVHPFATEIAGLRVHGSLEAIPGNGRIELVNLFVRPERTVKIIEQAARIQARIAWFQPGAACPEAERLARELGIEVVSGRCTMAEHQRLLAR